LGPNGSFFFYGGWQRWASPAESLSAGCARAWQAPGAPSQFRYAAEVHARRARGWALTGVFFFHREAMCSPRGSEELAAHTSAARRKTEDGRRKTEDGRRKTEDGRRSTVDGRPPRYRPTIAVCASE